MDSKGKNDLKQTQNSLITAESDNKESEMAKSKSIIASSAERKPSNIKIDLLTYRQESHQTFPLSFTEFDWSLLVFPDSVLVWVTGFFGFWSWGSLVQPGVPASCVSERF